MYAISFINVLNILVFHFFNGNFLSVFDWAIIFNAVRFFLCHDAFLLFFYIAKFPLVDLRNLKFLNLFISVWRSFRHIICRLFLLIFCSYLSMITVVTSVALDVLYAISVLLPTFLYLSIAKLFCAFKLFKMTFKLSKNNIKPNCTIHYLIKNLHETLI